MQLRRFAVIGHPIGHTMSPFIHDRLFSLTGHKPEYSVLDVPSLTQALPALRTLDGFNITIPHKSGIIPLLDGIDENGDIKPEAKAEVMNDLRAHFRPEFLNRLDETILFKPLTKNNIGSIIDLLVADINKRLADKELVVALSDSAKQFIVDNGYDPVYGARPLKRYLQKNVETLAARLILSDGVHTGDTIRIDVVDGKLNASAERGTKE